MLKSLVNELANPRGKVTGRPITVKPEADEKFHRMHRGNRENRAVDIAEQNLTPNAVVDQRMSNTPNLHPSDYLQEDEEEDLHIPSEEAYGQNISDATPNFGTRSNPFGQPEEKPPSMMEMRRNRFIQNPPQGPLALQDLRQFPENPVNPFKLKSSPFEFAWTMLKEDVNYLHDAVESIQRMFGVDYEEAMRMVEQMHHHQLSQAGIPQNKIDRESADDGGASDYLNQQFAKPMAEQLRDVVASMGDTASYQQYKDNNSRRIGEQTSRAAMTNRPRSSPRVPQMSEEASYANISVPRESPIHGIEPFGEDEPMGATLPEPRRMSPLGESPMPQRSEDPPNPFNQESPTSKRLKEMVGQMNMPSKKPLELEGAGERAPIEFPQNIPMSQGPSRQQRRGMPGAGVSVKRPGFRGPPMPIGNDPMSDEGQIAVKEKRNFNSLPQEKNINTPEGTLNVASRMFGAGPSNLDDRLRRHFNKKRKTVLNEDVEGYPYNHPADGD